ncbi:MAG: TetR/AcrR family transcriptional regulator [Candidatus Methylomirabilis sp.]|nr:TetR/AcrR family transcriptional regulator [Deltaproteobacteria bacterium]
MPNARERLLKAARTLFARFGFEGAKTRAIAHLAGCDRSLIGQLFGGKEGLYREVLADYVGLIRSLAEDAAFWAAPPLERCRLFVDRWCDLDAREPDLVRIVLRETLSGSILREDLSGPAIRLIYRVAEDAVREFQSAGEAPPVDARHFLASAGGVLLLPSLAAEALRELLGVDLSAAHFVARRKIEAVDLLFHGILPPGARCRAEEPARGPSGTSNESGAASLDAKDACPMRRALLSAGARLFALRGFRGVSLQDIHDVARAGYGSHRFHFGSKWEFYVEVIRDTLAAFVPMNLDPHYLTEDARTNYTRIVGRMHEIARVNPYAIKLVLRDILDGGEGLKEVFGDQVPHLFGWAARNLESQQRRGMLRDFDPLLFQLHFGGLTLFYFAAAEFYSGLWARDALAPEQVERRNAEVLGLLLRGVKIDD